MKQRKRLKAISERCRSRSIDYEAFAKAFEGTDWEKLNSDLARGFANMARCGTECRSILLNLGLMKNL